MYFRKEYTYTYKDIALVPAKLSRIEHRSECSPYISSTKTRDQKMLPIFAAPMSSIINQQNYCEFIKNGIIPILPRSESYDTRLNFALNSYWASFSKAEAEAFLIDSKLCKKIKALNPETPFRMLIDVANGHMSSLYTICRALKNKLGATKIEIMIGNIANPETYAECVESGVDYIRCSIGTGDGCTTSTNTGIHFGIVSLLEQIDDKKRKLSSRFRKFPKIIADGGIRGYSDVIKALAMGADFVMIGGLFGTCKESCGDKIIDLGDGSELVMDDQTLHKWRENPDPRFVVFGDKEYKNCDVYTDFYGMASEKGQMAMSGSVSKVAEGISKRKKVTTTLEEWTKNMIASLQSAMSYSNSKTLKNFHQNAYITLVSPNTYNSINH